MPEPVLEAMRQAAGSFVSLETMQERIGERLARRISVEGALVTCGAASGVQPAAVHEKLAPVARIAPSSEVAGIVAHLDPKIIAIAPT